MRRACWLLLAVGCARVDELDLGALAYDRLFVVSYASAGGSAPEVKGPFLPGAFDLSVDLDDDLAVVTIETATLTARVVGFRADQLDALKLEVGPVPEPAYDGLGVASLRVPPSSSVFVSASDGASTRTTAGEHPLFASLVLRAPYDPGHCARDTLVPFAAAERVIPDEAYASERPSEVTPGYVSTLQRVRWVDASRVLVMSAALLAVVREGRAPVFPTSIEHGGPPKEVLTMWNLPPGRADIEAFAIDPRTRADGSRRVLVVGGAKGTGSVRLPMVWELTLDDRGLSFVGTASIAGPPIAGDLLDVDIADDGAVIAVGQAGLVLTQSASTAPFLRAPPLPNHEGVDVERAIHVRGLSERHALATRMGALLVGDVERARLRSVRAPDLAGSTSIDSLRQDPLSGALWMAGARGGLWVRPPGSAAEAVAIAPPPTLDACSDGVGGALSFSEKYYDVLPRGDEVLLALNRCSAIIRVVKGPDGTCVAPLLRAGALPESLGRSDIESVDEREGRVVAAGAFGAVLVVE